VAVEKRRLLGAWATRMAAGIALHPDWKARGYSQKAAAGAMRNCAVTWPPDGHLQGSMETRAIAPVLWLARGTPGFPAPEAGLSSCLPNSGARGIAPGKDAEGMERRVAPFKPAARANKGTPLEAPLEEQMMGI
jgi:hypothetical protein